MKFVTYFKRYINGWFAAAQLIPAVATWKYIPAYTQQRPVLFSFSVLSGALILAFLFTFRSLIIALSSSKSHLGIAASFLAPIGLIGASLFSLTLYYKDFVDTAHYFTSFGDAIKNNSLDKIPNGSALMVYYVLAIVFAEIAFFFLAIREWREESAEQVR